MVGKKIILLGIIMLANYFATCQSLSQDSSPYSGVEMRKRSNEMESDLKLYSVKYKKIEE